MGSGAKIALVALLILMVVAVASFVQNGKDSGTPGSNTGKAVTGVDPAAKGAANTPRLVPAKPATAVTSEKVTPGTGLPVRSNVISSRGPSSGTVPPAGAAGGTPATASGSSSAGGTPGLPSGKPAADPPGAADLARAGGESGSSGAPKTEGGPGPVSSSGSSPIPPAPANPGTSGTNSLVGAQFGPGSNNTGASPTRPDEIAQANTSRDLAPRRPDTGAIDGAGTPTPRGSANERTSEGPAITMLVPQTPPRGATNNPTPAPAPAIPPSSRSFPIVHTIEAGDSYWRLAEKYYGAHQGKLHASISAANGGAKLLPGKTVRIPAPPAVVSAPPGSSSSPEPGARPAPRAPGAPATGGIVTSDAQFHYYQVQRGDTLSGLARRFLGSPTKIAAIEQANPDLRFEALREGSKIRIPRQQ